MENGREPVHHGGRGRVVAVEAVLLVLTLWILIWRPIGEALSLIVAIMLALLFIGLFPAMLKGDQVAQAEREHLARRFSVKDDNRER